MVGLGEGDVGDGGEPDEDEDEGVAGADIWEALADKGSETRSSAGNSGMVVP